MTTLAFAGEDMLGNKLTGLGKSPSGPCRVSDVSFPRRRLASLDSLSHRASAIEYSRYRNKPLMLPTARADGFSTSLQIDTANSAGYKGVLYQDQYFNYGFKNFCGDTYTELYLDGKANAIAEYFGHPATIIGAGGPRFDANSARFGSGASLYLDNSGTASSSKRSFSFTSYKSPSEFVFDQSTVWTFECWVYPVRSATYDQFIASTNGWFLYIRAVDGKVCFSNSAFGAQLPHSVVLTSQQWAKVEVGCNGSTLYLIVNGVTPVTSVANSWGTGNNTIWFGSRNGNFTTYPNTFLSANFDEIRLTKGACRHTSAYTPESATLRQPTAMTLATKLPTRIPSAVTTLLDGVLMGKIKTAGKVLNTDLLIRGRRSTADSFHQFNMSAGTLNENGETVWPWSVNSATIGTWGSGAQVQLQYAALAGAEVELLGHYHNYNNS